MKIGCLLISGCFTVTEKKVEALELWAAYIIKLCLGLEYKMAPALPVLFKIGYRELSLPKYVP